MKRAQALPKKYGMVSRAAYATMTADMAQEILKELTDLEFPKLIGFSIVFALFKVLCLFEHRF